MATETVNASFLLLEDGFSYALLENGVDRILLEKSIAIDDLLWTCQPKLSELWTIQPEVGRS